MNHLFKNAHNIIAIQPPVEDFTAYSLWAAPIGLLRVINELRKQVKTVSYYDFLDDQSIYTSNSNAVKPKFRKDGRHSYVKQEIEKPSELSFVQRKYFRFGADDDYIATQLKSCKKPDLFILSTGMTYWYKTTLQVVSQIQTLYPDIPIVVGGIAAVLMPELFEAHAVAPYTTQFVQSGDLSYVEKELQKLSFFPAQLIQGCPCRCTYCSSKLFHEKVSFTDIQKQAAQLETWHNNTGLIDVSFYDDALLLKKGETLKKFLSILQPGTYRFHTPNGLHLREIDASIAELLHHYNFSELRFGFETIDNTYDSKSSVRQLFEKISLLKSAGFSHRNIGIYLLCGMPGQTVESVEKSIDMVVQAGGRPYLSEFSPVPGTPLFESHLKESAYDFKKEPIYQNNTLSGYRSPVFNVNVIKHLREKLSSIYYLQDKK